MNFDIVNILAVISAVASVVIFIKMTRDYVAQRTLRTNKKIKQKVQSIRESSMLPIGWSMSGRRIKESTSMMKRSI